MVIMCAAGSGYLEYQVLSRAPQDRVDKVFIYRLIRFWNGLIVIDLVNVRGQWSTEHTVDSDCSDHATSTEEVW